MTGTIALYMRISSEDANEGESFSIGHQRDLLYHFVKSRREFDGYTVMEFLDDGYTGTNFDRPGVQKMLSMAGNPIQCIIVKDFSRFGRNLIDVITLTRSSLFWVSALSLSMKTTTAKTALAALSAWMFH